MSTPAVPSITQSTTAVDAVLANLRQRGWAVLVKDGKTGDEKSIWLGDTATTHYVIGSASTKPNSEKTTNPVDMWTAAGVETVDRAVTADTDQLGEVTGYHMPNSPNLIPIGRRVIYDGELFIWSKQHGPQLYEKSTQFTPPQAKHVQFQVDQYVFFFCGAAAETEDDKLQIKDVADEVERRLQSGASSIAGAPASTQALHAAVAAVADNVLKERSKTHMPAMPEICEACRFAKSTITKSFASDPEERVKTTATQYDGKIHVDIIGPTQPSDKGERYLLTARDDASGQPNVAGLKDKTSETTWAGFDEAVDISKVKAIQKDYGGEFGATFHDNCVKH